jgi:hypothetical protein
LSPQIETILERSQLPQKNRHKQRLSVCSRVRRAHRLIGGSWLALRITSIAWFIAPANIFGR